MDQIVSGTIHGNTIVLNETPGLPDGQSVTVVISPAPLQTAWGEGIAKSAGGWADFPEMDAIMAKIHAQRRLERRSPATS